MRSVFEILLIAFAFVSLARPQDTITANQLRAPVKARDALDRARAAMAKQDLETAAKQLDRALRVYPEYAAALTMRHCEASGRQP